MRLLLGTWVCGVVLCVKLLRFLFLPLFFWFLLLFYFLCCIRDVVCSCLGRIAFVIAAANWSVVA
jgi:hypothetical protein